MKEKKMNKRKMIPILILLIILVVVIAGSYAWLTFAIESDNKNTLRAGTLSLILDDSATEGISIENAIPTSEEKGITQEGYTFKLKNNGSIPTDYKITLENYGSETEDERIPDSSIRYELIKDGINQTQEKTGTINFIPGDYIATFDQEKHQFTNVAKSNGDNVSGLSDALNSKLNETITTGTAIFEDAVTVFKSYIGAPTGYEINAPKNSGILESRQIDQGTINKNVVHNYTLKVWIDESVDSEIMGKVFSAKLKIEAEQSTTKICKRAKVLHEEECSQNNPSEYCSGAGYTTAGEKGTTTISYGNLGTSGTLSSGDAFDCDVNGDGVYDAATERFYYASDYYNPETKEYENDTAVLIYYNGVSNGEPNNSLGFAYDSSGENWHGPRTAIEQLPTTSKWTTKLKKSTRQILTQNNMSVTGGGTLPTKFKYSNYAARLLATKELEKACNITVEEYTGSAQKGPINTNCEYMLENTRYSNPNLIPYIWLETPYASSPTGAWMLNVSYYDLSHGTVDTTATMVRPVIEVAKSKISY